MADVAQIYPENSVNLREVGLRDGLQMVKSFPDTAGKRKWIEQEFSAGVRHFEVGSFLPASKYPMFADVLDVIGVIESLPGAHGAALALNKRGTIDALQSGVAEIGCVLSASAEHNLANTRRSQRDTLSEIENLCRMRDATDHKPLISVGLAMAFGCSLSGAVNPSVVLKLVEQCYALGVDMVSLADTVGYAGPKQVSDLVASAHKLASGKVLGVHLHDTRGMGIANASAALDEGVRMLDGAMGGLGGCPFAPNATGNVVFEDLVFLCETKGLRTGIDLEALTNIRDILRQEMPTETLYGAVAKAGIPLGFDVSR